MLAHLAADAEVVSTEMLTNEKELALLKLEQYSDLLSIQEMGHISNKILSAGVPSPRLLVKDHKEKKHGKYPTRLVVPVTNFTSGFPHVGMQGIKGIFEEQKIEFEERTTLNIDELVTDLDGLGICKQRHGVVSIDAEKMYPSIKFEMINKAVEYFMQEISEEEKKRVQSCLKMIKYGMSTTFIHFKNK